MSGGAKPISDEEQARREQVFKDNPDASMAKLGKLLDMKGPGVRAWAIKSGLMKG